MKDQSYIADLLTGVTKIYKNGAPIALADNRPRKILNLLGAGTLVDNPNNPDGPAYDLTLTGGSGGGTSPFFNVKDPLYGAVGDGVTDDTAAILSAISAKDAADGGTLYFPRGNYKVSATIDFGTAACVVMGEGWASSDPTVMANNKGTFLYSTLSTGNAFTVGASSTAALSGVSVLGIAFVSSAGGNTTTGLALRPNSSSSLSQVTIENVWCFGFAFGLNPGAATESVFRNIYLTNGGVGLKIAGVTGALNFNKNLFYGINVQNNTTGIVVNVAAKVSFFGGVAKNNSQAGIVVLPLASGGLSNLVQNVDFDGFWFEGNNSGTNAATDRGDIVVDVSNESIGNPSQVKQVTFSNCYSANTGTLQFARPGSTNSGTFATVVFDACNMTSATLALPSWATGCTVSGCAFSAVTDAGTKNTIVATPNFGLPGQARLGIVTNVHTTINVKDPTYGAKGDGVTDDTAAIQAAINAAKTTSTSTVGPPTLFFPMGIYIVSSTLLLDAVGPSSGQAHYIHIVGEVAGHGGFPATMLRWNGAANGVMMELSNAYSIRVHGLNFDANQLAKCCVNVRPFSTNMKWTQCGFLNTISYPCWQPNTHFAANSFIVVPQKNNSWFKDQQGTLFQSGAAGTTGATPPVFPFSSGGSVVDSGVTWTEVGFSPCTFAVGDQFGPYINSQVDTSVWRDCYFQGTGTTTHQFGTSPAASFATVSSPAFSPSTCEIGVVIRTGGTLGTATFTWTINGMPQAGSDATPVHTAASVTLGNTQVKVLFPSGMYNSGDFYTYGPTNAAGFRALSAGNTKQFCFEDCHFVSCDVAMDAHHGSGSYILVNCAFADNQCDLTCAGANIIVTGLESEGSAYLLYDNLGTAAPATVTILGSSWSGNTPAIENFTNYGDGDAFVHFGGGLTTEGCEWGDATMIFPCVVIGGAQNTLGSGAGSFRSRGCVFIGRNGYMTTVPPGELFFPVFDQNTNCYIPGTKQYLAQYLGGGDPVRISSQDDFFTPDSGGINIPIGRFDGQDLRLGRQQLGGKFGTNVTYPTLGSVIGACAKFKVPFNAVTLAYVSGSTSTVTLAKSWGKCRIKAVYVEAVTDFSGGTVASCTVSIGNQITAAMGGSATVDAYIKASSVFTGTAPFMYGLSSGDVGTAITSAVQGAAFIYLPTDGSPADSKEWLLTATFTTTTDTPNHLTAGECDVYVLFEMLPGFDP